ncbi:MAG TPA: response regulator [Gemmatimonadales bacterium]|nr:response regulator [Gemmatimonadales bacterium]
MKVEDRPAEPTTLLVVEDDLEMRSLLRDVLQGRGFRVLVESAGEGAMAVSESERLDVVIVDKEMPGLNGLDLLSFFRLRLPDVPVILITAFGGPRVAEEAFRRGAARYLEKPFRVTDLLSAIRSVTGNMRRSSTPEGRTQA